MEVYYQIEADFDKGAGWCRHHEKFKDLEKAMCLYHCFCWVKNIRIIKIENEIETIVEGKEVDINGNS